MQGKNCQNSAMLKRTSTHNKAIKECVDIACKT